MLFPSWSIWLGGWCLSKTVSFKAARYRASSCSGGNFSWTSKPVWGPQKSGPSFSWNSESTITAKLIYNDPFGGPAGLFESTMYVVIWCCWDLDWVCVLSPLKKCVKVLHQQAKPFILEFLTQLWESLPHLFFSSLRIQSSSFTWDSSPHTSFFLWDTSYQFCPFSNNFLSGKQTRSSQGREANVKFATFCSSLDLKCAYCAHLIQRYSKPALPPKNFTLSVYHMNLYNCDTQITGKRIHQTMRLFKESWSVLASFC